MSNDSDVPVHVFTSWVTSIADNADHAVTDEAMVAGMTSGHYVAVCGAAFTPAVMIEPERPACLSCLATFHARTPAPTPQRSRLAWRQSLKALLTRLFTWCHHMPVAPLPGTEWV